MCDKFSQFHCNNTNQEQSIAQHNATLEKGFHKDDGVFVQCLDKALDKQRVCTPTLIREGSGRLLINPIYSAINARLITLRGTRL